MANALNKTAIRKVLSPSDFPPIPDIDKMSPEKLDAHGYYKGYPCLHNHSIREKTDHWCYHCAAIFAALTLITCVVTVSTSMPGCGNKFLLDMRKIAGRHLQLLNHVIVFRRIETLTRAKPITIKQPTN